MSGQEIRDAMKAAEVFTEANIVRLCQDMQHIQNCTDLPTPTLDALRKLVQKIPEVYSHFALARAMVHDAAVKHIASQ